LYNTLQKDYKLFLRCPASHIDAWLLQQLISPSFLYRFCSTNEDKIFDNRRKSLYHWSGAKGVEIVVALGHPKNIVSTVLKEFEHCGSVEHPKSTGCRQKLSEISVRVITHELVQDRRQILADITSRSGFNVSASTVRKALHDVGFYSRIAQKTPFLSDTHRTKRLEFAREH
jgi:hypothetical protein